MQKDLKSDVVKILVTQYDFTMDDAESTVDASMKHADMWNENASADDLANFLASDENDD